MKAFNINDCIKVKLTDKGKEIIQEDYENTRAQYPELDLKPLYIEEADGFTEFQLWHFMQIFGEHFWCGAPAYIENNEIVFCDGELKACKETSQGDLISREALKNEFKARCIYNCNRCLYQKGYYCGLIDNAPAVKTNEMTQDLIDKVNVNIGLAQSIKDKRPQGELAEKLKDRIEESICKRCQMKENCVLCKISHVFQIIELTMEEQKGDAK